MWGTILFIIVVAGYILAAIFVIKLITKATECINPYLRLLVLSFFYALFWGISIAATGGDPGFGFPAPNGISIAIMYSIGFDYGVITGFYILIAWWVVIFLVMLAIHTFKRKQTTAPELQQNGQKGD